MEYLFLLLAIVLVGSLGLSLAYAKKLLSQYLDGPKLEILRQAHWYIHPLTGNDKEDGKTEKTALKTFAELSRRWGKGNTLSPNNIKSIFKPGKGDEKGKGVIVKENKEVTVHILDSLPPTDPLIFDVILDNSVALWFVGERLLSSVPLTVSLPIQSRNRDENTPWQFTTGGGLNVADRIYNENGKTYMWAVKDQGSNVFRISEPLKMPATELLDPLTDRITPLYTDIYKIQTLYAVKTGSMRVGSVHDGPYDSAKTLNKLVFRDLNITGDISPELDSATRLFCYGCKIEGSIHLATGFDRNFINCCQISGFTIRLISGLTRFFGGAYISAAVSKPPGSQGFLPTNCTTQFNFDVIFQSHSISIVAGNTLVIGTAGIFDSVSGGNGFSNSAGHGIMVSGGSVTCRKVGDDRHHLWGSDNNGAGVGVSSGGRFYYVDAAAQGVLPTPATGLPPTITGLLVTNDNPPIKIGFVLGEKIKVLGQPAHTHSYAPKEDGTFNGPFLNSWSKFKELLIPPVGSEPGFGGNAANPQSDAWILKTQ